MKKKFKHELNQIMQRIVPASENVGSTSINHGNAEQRLFFLHFFLLTYHTFFKYLFHIYTLPFFYLLIWYS